MSRTAYRCETSERGFSLIEVLVAMAITVIVMSSVFALLTKGQRSFDREPEIADLQQNARAGLDAISRDLTNAGYRTPPTIAVLWADGGGTTPDEITIVYGDPLFPTVWSLSCAEQNGPCNTIDSSSVLWVDHETYDPPQSDPTAPFIDGDALVVMESTDCNGDGEVGIVPFDLTQDPEMVGGKLKFQHNPGGGSDMNLPGGFNNEVTADCAVIGVFNVVQYRVNPLPPADNPSLERRNLGTGEDWAPLAANIEDFQVQYGIGEGGAWTDTPPLPDPNNPDTWIGRVSLTIRGRSESNNLEGGTTAFAASPEDTFIRQTYTTTMSLRNVVGNMEEFRVLNPGSWTPPPGALVPAPPPGNP